MIAGSGRGPAIGRVQGLIALCPCNLGVDLAAAPVALIDDATLNVDNPNNTTHTAGTTFLGQFLDHGLLQLDGNSYLNRFRWRPTLPRRTNAPVGDFRMVDLLTLAKVDPASRGQEPAGERLTDDLPLSVR